MMSPGSSRTIRKIPIETRKSVGIANAIRLMMYAVTPAPSR